MVTAKNVRAPTVEASPPLSSYSVTAAATAATAASSTSRPPHPSERGGHGGDINGGQNGRSSNDISDAKYSGQAPHYSSSSQPRRLRHKKWAIAAAMLLLASALYIVNVQQMGQKWNFQPLDRRQVTVSSKKIVLDGSHVLSNHTDNTVRNDVPRQGMVYNPVTVTTATLARATTAGSSSTTTTTSTVAFTELRPLPPTRHCHWNGIQAMRNFAQSYFSSNNTNGNGSSGNLCCDRIRQERANFTASLSKSQQVDKGSDELSLTLHITFGCHELFHRSGHGTGNYISLLYGLRLATAAHTNVGLNISCHDAEATKRDLIVPWLTGWFPPRVYPASAAAVVSTQQACGTFAKTPIVHMVRDMQYDFRRMAIGLVGIVSNTPNHGSARFFSAQSILSRQQDSSASASANTAAALRGAHWRHRLHLAVSPTSQPAFPPGSVVLDDAVLHFRCGDLMDSESPYFSFLPFSSLVQDISPDAQSIGIITQPFGNDNKSNNSRSNATTSQVRWFDARNTTQDRCRTVVHALVDYIQVRHPRSRITIHNGPHETIALAYARMVMANQSIAGISTFGVFPVLSTFGTGYLHQPHGVPSVTSWLFAKHGNRSISQVVPNLHVIYDRQYMMVSDMKKLWQTSGSAGVLAWFTSDWKRV